MAAYFILHLYTFQFDSTRIFCWLSYFGLGWDSFFSFTTIIEAFLATYMLSGQLSGFFIRYPDFKSSNKVSRGTPGYGDPPRKEHLKDINKL